MIDNADKTKELIEKMEAQLPIPVSPTRQLEQHMREQSEPLPPRLEIKRVFYAGDEGGIVCDVTPPDFKSAVICSLTHLHISRSHPLGIEIRAYQEQRKRQIALQDFYENRFAVRPRRGARGRQK